MFRTTLGNTIAIAALFTVAGAVPAPAAPPGYERWIAPDSDSNVDLEVLVPSGIANNVNSDIWGTKGYRPVDVEINWYNPKINWKNVEYDTPLHEISVVEVPNEGPLKEPGWLMALEETPDTIFDVLENVAARPIDIELYFRKESDIDGTVIVPRYACIWVPNKGENQSEWDFIPPMYYDVFMSFLNMKMDQGWRPVDIEFAVDFDGQPVGTALLAPEASFQSIGEDGSILEFVQVETLPTWFFPNELEGLMDQGWQLVDLELPPDIPDQGPFGPGIQEYLDSGARFGIFVKVPWMYAEGYSLPVSSGGIAPKGTNRLIDLEAEFYSPPCDGKLCEGGYYKYTSLWLIAD